MHVVKNAQYADSTPSSKPGFDKLRGAAQQALKDGYDFVWVDTCCIDKSSSAELSEAINSMFKWYGASEVCYAYLIDVPDTTDVSECSAFIRSQWWKRGWTLQELLAPSKLTFFTRRWKIVGHKQSLGTTIADITGIDIEVFGERMTLDSFSIAQRMSWASGRTTTRPEDLAYCLMGLFDVNMPVLYGEGEKAFIRLQQEIIKESDDQSISAWRDEPVSLTYSGMLATRPAAFAGSQNVDHVFSVDNRTPYSMTNKGVAIILPLYRRGRKCIAHLKCTTTQSGEPIGIFLQQDSHNGMHYACVEPQRWIEGKRGRYHEISSIFVRQSWSGTRGLLGGLGMTTNTERSTSATPESQDDDSRHLPGTID